MHVKLKVTPWVGDQATTLEAGDGAVLLSRGIEIGGEPVRARTATITLESSQFRDHSEIGSDGYLVGEGELLDFVKLELTGISPEAFDRLDPDDYTLGSTAERVGIIVSSFEVAYV